VVKLLLSEFKANPRAVNPHTKESVFCGIFPKLKNVGYQEMREQTFNQAWLFSVLRETGKVSFETCPTAPNGDAQIDGTVIKTTSVSGEAVEATLQSGVNTSPLFFAIIHRNPFLAKLLILHGAPVLASHLFWAAYVATSSILSVFFANAPEASKQALKTTFHLEKTQSQRFFFPMHGLCFAAASTKKNISPRRIREVMALMLEYGGSPDAKPEGGSGGTGSDAGGGLSAREWCSLLKVEYVFEGVLRNNLELLPSAIDSAWWSAP
jgi:hypothetical protein